MSDKEIRDWAREQGRDVSDRGPLSAGLRAEYELAHGFNEADGPTDADFPDDVSEAAAPPADTPEPERRPRNVQVPRKMPWQRHDTKGRKTRPKHKRVSLDDTIATGWRFLASLAKPLPATSRLLKIQAPVAGKILEPALRDTLVDRVLQPLARASEGAEAVAVLLVPPVVVTAMQLNQASIPLLMPVLRETLMRMIRISGPAMAEAMAQEKEFEEQFGGSVDDLIGLLLSEITVEEGESADQAEEAVVRRAQEAMAGTNVAA
jgi:hypothetical protein